MALQSTINFSSPSGSVDLDAALSFLSEALYNGALQETSYGPAQVGDDEDTDGNKSTANHGVHQRVEKPHILKNDIRRHYTQMYMNAMNSDDFPCIQRYLHTFMTGVCSFQVGYTSDPALNMPPALTFESPRMFAYFLLGGHVMFPDTVTYYHDVKLITSSKWPGTKVVLEVESHSTKICQLPVDAWVPSDEELAGMNGSNGVSGRLMDAGTSTATRGKRKRRKGTGVWKSRPYDPSHVSLDHLDALYQRATPLPAPIPVVSKGVVTMILDERCCIQHLSIILSQHVVPKRDPTAFLADCS